MRGKNCIEILCGWFMHICVRMDICGQCESERWSFGMDFTSFSSISSRLSCEFCVCVCLFLLFQNFIIHTDGCNWIELSWHVSSSYVVSLRSLHVIGMMRTIQIMLNSENHLKWQKNSPIFHAKFTTEIVVIEINIGELTWVYSEKNVFKVVAFFPLTEKKIGPMMTEII